MKSALASAAGSLIAGSDIGHASAQKDDFPR